MISILVNVREPNEARIAFVDDEQMVGQSPPVPLLVDYDAESTDHTQYRGNIYRGVVMNVEASLQAAFVDFGGGRHGFLPFSEIGKHAFAEGTKSAKSIGEAVKKKQLVTVQVTREAQGQKGAALTTYLSLPGRYAVLMLGESKGGISRKISDEAERQRLKEITEELPKAEGIGLIIRTAGLKATHAQLLGDCKQLHKTFAALLDSAREATGPTLLHREPDLILRTLRDYTTPEVKEIVVDDEAALKALRRDMKLVMPRATKLLKLYDAPRPLFSSRGIEPQIEALYRPRVSLPSGGSVVIERTEALVAIDVNSGKAGKAQSHESASHTINMEAAEVIARQLRLRDLGGIVVIDFIDMNDPAHGDEVEAHLKKCVAKDKARIKVGALSEFGTIQLTRQRMRPALADTQTNACTHCSGTGRLVNETSRLATVLRQIADKVAPYKEPRPLAFIVRAEPTLGLRLLNEARPQLQKLETMLGTTLKVELLSSPQGKLSIVVADNERKEEQT